MTTFAPDDVRWVVLSDLHLGDDGSLLTRVDPVSQAVDAAAPAGTLVGLVDLLRDLIDRNAGGARPTLIVNGDFLDLAVSRLHAALMHFRQFAGLVLAPGDELFDRIVFLPGNHDHHLWEIARETQYARAIDASGPTLPPMRHSTPPSLDDAVPSFLLSRLLRTVRPLDADEDRQRRVAVVYPNLVLTAGGRRAVILHHGHYAEGIYHLISRAYRWLFPGRPLPATVEALESENFAWIDFFWSLLGQSGAAAPDIETLSEMLHYPEHVGDYADRLAARAAAARDLPWIPGDRVEEAVLKHVFSTIAERFAGERFHRERVCTAETMGVLGRYLFGPTLEQVRSELGAVPPELAFLWGHTHKPFEKILRETRSARDVAVYNSGGWVIDSLRPAPTIGASALLLNEALDVAALRFFFDAPGGGEILFDVVRPDGVQEIEVGPPPEAPLPAPGEGHDSSLVTHPGPGVSVAAPPASEVQDPGAGAVEAAGERLDFARAMQLRVRTSVAEGSGWDAFAEKIRAGMLRRRRHLEATFGP
ncbi:MAG TPA: metallophosphoesterase [Longimicrobiales bacterium]|nr:metallophosphoesterase [Longimicrobiales bacterium]